ncbi:Carboxyl-terminal-processing peptidase 2, chloroplastic [Vitis vinifera]|uniref:Carboxyl-terminal-processing peptidase 2, chloroplastic n=1 Tax=Vitis vinifera TaxID=29760 RepID=A0A438JEY4_VITVI|nr:Carboxyl-terminal-processing peptidase 2, chloroplastic [Vitis vinifera]
MEALGGFAAASLSPPPPHYSTILQTPPWKSLPQRIGQPRLWSPLLCISKNVSYGLRPKLRKYTASLQKELNCSERFKHHVSVHFVRLVVGVMLVMSVSVGVSRTPSWALTEENLLFLEAWRTIDRAYVDKHLMVKVGFATEKMHCVMNQ